MKNSLDLQTFKYNNTNFQADTNILKDCRLISSYSTYVILAQEKISSTYFEVNVLTTFQIRTINWSISFLLMLLIQP